MSLVARRRRPSKLQAACGFAWAGYPLRSPASAQAREAALAATPRNDCGGSRRRRPRRTQSRTGGSLGRPRNPELLSLAEQGERRGYPTRVEGAAAGRGAGRVLRHDCDRMLAVALVADRGAKRPLGWHGPLQASTSNVCLASRSDAVARRRRASSAFYLHYLSTAARVQQPGAGGDNAGGSPVHRPARRLGAARIRAKG